MDRFSNLQNQRTQQSQYQSENAQYQNKQVRYQYGLEEYQPKYLAEEAEVFGNQQGMLVNGMFPKGFDALQYALDNADPADYEKPLATPEPETMLRVKTANAWVCEAASRPDPRPLWLSMWHEGELCCLFADSNLGKSIYAVQIAREISRKEPVIYFDFELSDKQFQLRYTDENGFRITFPETFLRAEIDTQALGCEYADLEDRIIADIETAALHYEATKLIIDNLSFLCNASDKSDMAGRLMLRLVELKKRLGLSILVLAHTPKRSLTSPITQNDLAGSKKLFNFFDSVFAIGKSARDESLRYINQLKVRAGQFEYDSDNVIVAEIVKEDGWLHFEAKGRGRERDHLKEERDEETDAIRDNITQLRKEGKTIREIASLLDISKSRVGRIIKSIEG